MTIQNDSDDGERLDALYGWSSPKESQVKACEVRSALGARCWPLYYATSTYRLKRILRENCLRTEPDHKIALTSERSLAEYWAHLDVFGDRQDYPDEETHPVVPRARWQYRDRGSLPSSTRLRGRLGRNRVLERY